MKNEKKVSTIKFWCPDREHYTVVYSDGSERILYIGTEDQLISNIERVGNDIIFYLRNGEQIIVNDKDFYGEMVIREYEYEISCPWNCQERFIIMKECGDPWQEYKDKLLGNVSSDISMRNRIIKDTMREVHNALSFEFEINGGRFVHVAQDWTKQYDTEPITKIIYGR